LYLTTIFLLNNKATLFRVTEKNQITKYRLIFVVRQYQQIFIDHLPYALGISNLYNRLFVLKHNIKQQDTNTEQYDFIINYYKGTC